MTRIRRDTIGYLLIIGFCILMLTWAIPVYTPAYPGYGAPPAMVPNVAVCVMLFMACISLVRVVLAVSMNKPIPVAETNFPGEQGDGGGFTQVGRVNLKHLCSIMIPCVLLLVAIDLIGYELASFAFLMILQYVIGSRKWIQSVVVSVVLVVVLYVTMRYGFGVPVPGPQIFQ
ncbi:MAG: tripartite tricarboxylate transporter TctB family protein [Gammaproteobacteria bacterium]|nr:tripartite tricarboxylate transporter TctB family protein [Gammaproteobacteria bacterium]